MRIAAGLIYHESNTFFSQATTLARFEEKDLHYGREILDHWKGTCSEMAGFMEGANRFGFELVPTVAAWGMPAGPLTKDTFETLSDSLISRLRQEMPLDGVLLGLHGAMVSESFPDADGELLRRVRDTIGSTMPLVVTLDYHANVTDEMVRWPDAMIGYDTYPHIDQAERGLEAAEIISRMVRDGMRPKLALARRSLFPHILRQLTAEGPMAAAIALAHQLEQAPDMVSVSVAAGFPYSDVPDTGFSVFAVARDDQKVAARAAERVADFVWSRREEFQVTLPSPAEAVREAIAQPAELLRQQVHGALVLLCDPQAVSAAVHAGVRQRLRVAVGAKVDTFHGSSVEIEGVVRTISDGVFKNIGPMRDGVVDDQGLTAVIDTGAVLVVLTERRMPMWNLQQLRAIGIEPNRLSIIVVKAAIAYRAAYVPIAQRIIEVDTPGLAAADVRTFSYKRLKRPMYPLDSI
jgi:microcystin degradation protein MlrC